jgi:hypothetical protein
MARVNGDDLSEEHKEQDDSDEEVEIALNAPRPAPTEIQASDSSLNLRPAVRAQQHHASIPRPPLPTSISVHTYDVRAAPRVAVHVRRQLSHGHVAGGSPGASPQEKRGNHAVEGMPIPTF